MMTFFQNKKWMPSTLLNGSRLSVSRDFLFVVILSLSFLGSAEGAFFLSRGETGFSFLKIPLSARGVGLAGAFTSVEGDVGALDYNPAGLSGLSQRDITFSHIQHIEEASLQSFSVGFPFRPHRFSKDRRNNPEVNPDKVFLGFQYRLFRIENDQRNELGLHLGSFENRNQLIHLGMAYRFSSSLSMGWGGKLINSELQNKSITLYAFDAGFIWKPSSEWSWGLSLLNGGPSKAFLEEKDPLPLLVRIGASRQARSVRFLGDVAISREKTIQPASAMEWNFARLLHLRGGVLYHTTIEFSGGIGIHFSPPGLQQKGNNPHQQSQKLQFGVDYAVQTQNELGLSHTVTLKILY
ncbi:hypothetical protein BVX98_02405 [bacterium F11]|nr:hypothetical protein BVX98_02405 [bacterium F11]